jgi:membrane AbrB-like protein
MTATSLMRDLPNVAFMLSIGLVGAYLATLGGLPMPYLVGALTTVGIYSAWRTATGRDDARFPQKPRRFFVALIGTMIGASFSLELMRSLPGIWPSLLVMFGFIAVALGGGYVLFRFVGGYDRVTAVFASMPGGLIEAVTLGEEAGADVRLLALQHFVRVIMVVIAVPILYLIWSGDTVGSAGGQSFEGAGWSMLDVVELIVLALAGMWLGPRLRLPAAHMVGPLLLSAALHGSGMLHLSSPGWLLSLAQLVVGTGLGTSFAGSRPRDLGRAMGLGFLYIAGVLSVGYGIASALAPVMPFDFDTLFISFAPGGVTEMGLIALSLGISPVVVTAHHVFRIGATVLFASTAARRFRARALGE